MNKAEFEFRAGMARHVEGQTKAAADLEAYPVESLTERLWRTSNAQWRATSLTRSSAKHCGGNPGGRPGRRKK